MKAVPLFQRRVIVAVDAFVEIDIWRVPQPVSPSVHPFRYRLAYVVRSHCVLRYDNERGKGDHRHIHDREEPYAFVSPEQLMADFQSDILRWNHEHGHS